MGRFSKRILQEGEQIATFHYETGLYSLNLKGGRIIKENTGKNLVKIDFDLKTNTIYPEMMMLLLKFYPVTRLLF